MELQSHYTFDAPIEAVWALLMDTSVVARCVPGCRELRPIGEDRYQAGLHVAVSAVTGDFQATIAIEDKIAPRGYTIVVAANGRPGFVNGRAAVSLEPEDAGTAVHVNATADVGGSVARIGQRLLQSAARMLLDRFFNCLRSCRH